MFTWYKFYQNLLFNMELFQILLLPFSNDDLAQYPPFLFTNVSMTRCNVVCILVYGRKLVLNEDNLVQISCYCTLRNCHQIILHWFGHIHNKKDNEKLKFTYNELYKSNFVNSLHRIDRFVTLGLILSIYIYF